MLACPVLPRGSQEIRFWARRTASLKYAGSPATSQASAAFSVRWHSSPIWAATASVEEEVGSTWTGASSRLFTWESSIPNSGCRWLTIAWAVAGNIGPDEVVNGTVAIQSGAPPGVQV